MIYVRTGTGFENQAQIRALQRPNLNHSRELPLVERYKLKNVLDGFVDEFDRRHDNRRIKFH